MFEFFLDIFHKPRRILAKRKEITVVSQVFQFKFDEAETKETVRGWLHLADCLEVNAAKLRAVDTVAFLSSLDRAHADINVLLEQLFSQIRSAPLADDMTLIELSKLIGHVKGTGN